MQGVISLECSFVFVEFDKNEGVGSVDKNEQRGAQRDVSHYQVGGSRVAKNTLNISGEPFSYNDNVR